jgi:hypothetical protein
MSDRATRLVYHWGHERSKSTCPTTSRSDIGEMRCDAGFAIGGRRIRTQLYVEQPNDGRHRGGRRLTDRSGEVVRYAG